MDINILAKEVLEDVVKWRRDLHQIPEVGQELPKTAKYICKQLEDLAISYRKGVGLDSAIVGEIVGRKGPGRTLALRADMDALPVHEETGLSFASTNGNMHACGHDAHVAILLGAAKVLNELREEFSGKIVLLFQPAEEISAGAKPMIDAGAIDGVDGILGLHVGNISSQGEPGKALFSKGSMMACLDKWNLKIKGIGSHGAYPHNSHDPVVMAGNIISAIQTIISREIDPVDPGVITVGKINGGTAYNVIPGEVELEGTTRAVNKETREFLARRIGEVAKLTAEVSRGSVEYNYEFGAPPVVNDQDFATNAMESTIKVLGDNNVALLDNPVMGGEDFSYYLEKVPGTFIFLSNPCDIDGIIYPHHNSKFDIDEQYLDRGVAIFLQVALDYLKE